MNMSEKYQTVPKCSCQLPPGTKEKPRFNRQSIGEGCRLPVPGQAVLPGRHWPRQTGKRDPQLHHRQGDVCEAYQTITESLLDDCKSSWDRRVGQQQKAMPSWKSVTATELWCPQNGPIFFLLLTLPALQARIQSTFPLSFRF